MAEAMITGFSVSYSLMPFELTMQHLVTKSEGDLITQGSDWGGLVKSKF